MHQIIVYRVNPEYAALYQNSGNSTLSLEEPPTNIENGNGIFTGAMEFLQVRVVTPCIWRLSKFNQLFSL